ncbi:hypothetical protein LCGC14_1286310 [marine sediment metagenome]|uniref:Uncharacterized protein n=1 Tax=marine sediment metagenome TaxID=412755 RepID=A0A0F9KTR9_9ZZZZ
MDEECQICKEKGIICLSCEFDKQDRIIDTMRFIGNDFLPNDSQAILVFKKGLEDGQGS